MKKIITGILCSICMLTVSGGVARASITDINNNKEQNTELTQRGLINGQFYRVKLYTGTKYPALYVGGMRRIFVEYQNNKTYIGYYR